MKTPPMPEKCNNQTKKQTKPNSQKEINHKIKSNSCISPYIVDL